jgi:hypothetical protein
MYLLLAQANHALDSKTNNEVATDDSRFRATSTAGIVFPEFVLAGATVVFIGCCLCSWVCDAAGGTTFAGLRSFVCCFTGAPFF